MEDATIGLVIRALRRRRGLRQLDVAHRAGVSQQSVSELERGHLTRLTVRTVRRIAGALDVDVPFAGRWRGPQLDRLLDGAHAALVEHVVALLRRDAWEVVVEYTFSHYGERGSVDVVGWRPEGAALLVVEVKTRIVDLQDLLAAHDRKVRLAPELLRRDRGWDARSVGRLLVVAATRGNRDALARHAATVAAVLPGRAREARRWIRQPSGPLAATWFVASTSRSGDAAGRGGPDRVRAPQRVRAGSGPRSTREPEGHVNARGPGPAARVPPYHQP